MGGEVTLLFNCINFAQKVIYQRNRCLLYDSKLKNGGNGLSCVHIYTEVANFGGGGELPIKNKYSGGGQKIS